MVRCLVVALLVGSTLALPAAAEEPPEAPTLASRLDAVERSAFASAAEGTVNQARGALARAEGLRDRGDREAAARAEAIARAATHLAERQVARAREHANREAAARRLTELRQRLEQAVAALARVRARVSAADDAQSAAAEAAANAEEEPE